MLMLRHIVNGTVTLLAGVAVLAVLGGAVLMALGFRPEPVLSGSMEPLMPVGSLVVVKATPAASVRVGDVVTFRHPLAPSKQITHRVIAVTGTGAGRRFTTKGDALAKRDPWQIALPGQVGRRVTTVPYLGTVMQRLSQRTTLAAIAALTTVLLLAGVLRALWGPRDRRRETTPAHQPPRAAATAYGTPW
jgi:signal peptidase